MSTNHTQSISLFLAHKAEEAMETHLSPEPVLVPRLPPGARATFTGAGAEAMPAREGFGWHD